jgi:hypothetical protein
MYRSILSIWVVMILSIAAYSQDSSSNKKNSLVAGAWAMQFQIDGFINLRYFQGTTISIKKHMTNKSAVRLGIGISLNISAEDYQMIKYQEDNEFNYQSRDYYSNRLNINSQYLYYLIGETDVNLFLGVGPQLNYSWDQNEYDRDTLWQSDKYHSIGFGVIGIAGVEWFAKKSISFHAEYSTSVEYRWSESIGKQISINPSRTRDTKSKNNYFTFYPNSVRFGMSVYF